MDKGCNSEKYILLLEKKLKQIQLYL